MSSTGSGYDLSPTTFSPEGRIFQVEYATKAVENSGTSMGIRCTDGVVMGVEKVLLSKLLKKGANKQIATISEHSGMAFSGFGPDSRQLVNRAREEAHSYDDTYGSAIPPNVLAERMSQYMHYFTLHGALRPFGTGAIVAAYDPERKEHQLYMIEPSGVNFRFYGCALGKGRQGAKTEIEKLDLNTLTCRQALKEVARIIHILHDEAKDKPFELELSWLCAESGWKHTYVPAALKTEVEEAAKKEIEDAEMEEDEEEDEEEEKA
uniref:Proteasome subunit alpha type n=1 Tax=Florenciella parvula TaxID=236787 RepID=A0A7S2BRB3_9STRA